MISREDALKRSPERIILAVNPDDHHMIVVVNKDAKFRGRIANAPPAGSKGYEYVRADLYDDLKADYEKLKP